MTPVLDKNYSGFSGFIPSNVVMKWALSPPRGACFLEEYHILKPMGSP